jgi:2-dehydro-3-deoxyphosphooctonate aldolase (KDO 8-P synthase)
MTLDIARRLQDICGKLGLSLIFKASFDKANRSSATGFRGPGLRGLAVLEKVRALGLAVTTDVHLPMQAAEVARVVDLLQVPAFLCRQTDLLVACAETGLPVNVKKGQFLAPGDMRGVVDKVNGPVMLTERGSSFGYNNLVADLRSLPTMRALGVPVCFDCTHSVQLPGARGDSSGGQREMAPVLARAAVAAGIDALFMEVHPDPERGLSDPATMLPLGEVAPLLSTLMEIDAVVK